MLDSLEIWWNNVNAQSRHDHALEISIIRLMIEMMKKDNKLDMSEHDGVIRMISKRFGLSCEAAEKLLEEVILAESDGLHLNDLAQQVESHYHWIDLATLLDDIWCVTEGDEHSDHLEDDYVRRISSLLGMSNEPLMEPSQQH
jgi:uncharacterized tellurite resistance protein B-like protein